MDNSIEIRTAKKEDVHLILSFIKELAEYEHLAQEVVATEEMLTESLFGKDSITEVLLAYYNNKPVGFALFFHNFSTFLGRKGIYLEDIYVKPQHRGKGIGKALLVKLAKIAKERNCGRLGWAVLNWNKAAIEFFESLGAIPMDEWRTYRMAGKSLTKLADKSKS